MKKRTKRDPKALKRLKDLCWSKFMHLVYGEVLAEIDRMIEKLEYELPLCVVSSDTPISDEVGSDTLIDLVPGTEDVAEIVTTDSIIAQCKKLLGHDWQKFQIISIYASLPEDTRNWVSVIKRRTGFTDQFINETIRWDFRALQKNFRSRI